MKAVFWKDLLLQGLKEDQYSWDWTTRAIRSKKKTKAKARIIAKESGTWAGTELFSAVSLLARELDSPLQVKGVEDSERVKKGQEVATWEGDSETILSFERPFLNLAAYVSGVATATRGMVDRVEVAARKQKLKVAPRITLTRKVLPYYKDLALHGVICGGGFPHRMNLAGGVLIKENHIAVAGGVEEAILLAQGSAPHSLRIEIEVRTLDELVEAAQAGAEVIMLDNFSPAQVRKALSLLKKQNGIRSPIIEVSGGLNEQTLSQYVISGVDVLSLGSITHSVRALDLSLLLS